MKPIHGAPQPKNVPSDMVDEPPIPCEFSVGDVVTYTNDYGVTFKARVRGFKRKMRSYDVTYHLMDGDGPTGELETEHVTSPNFIYLEFWCEWLGAWSTDGTAWWFPNKPEQLKKELA